MGKQDEEVKEAPTFKRTPRWKMEEELSKVVTLSCPRETSFFSALDCSISCNAEQPSESVSHSSHLPEVLPQTSTSTLSGESSTAEGYRPQS